VKRGGQMKRTAPLRRGGPLRQRAKRRPGAAAPEFTEKYGKDVVHARSDGLCEKCGQARAEEWHHRLNRGQGGTWDPANGLHLCKACHRIVTASDQILFDNGWRIRRKDPRPASEVPVLHWQWGFVHLDSDGVIHRRAPALEAS
jgi:hypothetical protein